jgi:hypothetical protein
VEIPRPALMGDAGEVALLLGVLTLSGTIGLMKSLCRAKSRVSVAAGAVSVSFGARSIAAASAFDLSWSVRSVDGGVAFRGICSGLLAGWYFSGGAISDLPMVLLQGSTAGWEDLVPNRPTRSPRLILLFSGPPVTETWYPIGRLSADGAPFAYEPGLTDAAFPKLLGSPEYSSHFTLLFGASFPSQNFCFGPDCESPA